MLARQAEVWAAFLEHTDHQVGRVLDAIKEEGKADNTLVLYIVGDNGGEAAGGLDGQDQKNADGSQVTDPQARLKRLDDLGGESFNNLYAGAWAWATNTPFQWSKQVASHLGGARDPLVVSWPARIKDKGGLRSQFHHVNDIAPTIYEAAGIKFPEVVDGVKQAPLEGKSLAYSFDDAKAPSNHRVQYFEMVGNRGIYKDGWWAGARHLVPWRAAGSYNDTPIGQHPWELYNLNQDYSQAHDLAASNPAKLKELVALFDAEAKRNDVYPLVPKRARLPSPADGKSVFTYRQGVERISLKIAPDLSRGSHTITADIRVPAEGAQGVIIAEGGRYGGFSLYVKDGRLVYDNNAFGAAHDRIVSSEPLPTGKIQVAFEFVADPKSATSDAYPGRSVVSGTGRLLVNSVPVGEGRLPRFGGFTYETLDVGSDLGSPVPAGDYASPARFTGTIDKVTVELVKEKLTQN
ncbi:MAG: sulfatase-like hydrolase/transferase [Magnetospirillum sp.]|nr:sulfatase-like hydrolase/transferase [Magnetospirillum sp.]